MKQRGLLASISLDHRSQTEEFGVIFQIQDMSNLMLQIDQLKDALLSQKKVEEQLKQVNDYLDAVLFNLLNQLN